MKNRTSAKLIREGRYIAEVDVELIEMDDEWSPYLSLEDSYKLDEVRKALQAGNLQTAASLAHVFSLTPVAA